MAVKRRLSLDYVSVRAHRRPLQSQENKLLKLFATFEIGEQRGRIC